MIAALVAPFVVQAAVMFVDERVYHRRRGLPRYERIGHPIDTLSAALCYAWLVFARPTRAHACAYAAIAIVSALVVTKDEPIHARACSPGEHWVHALLFMLHPIVLGAAAYVWWTGRLRALLVAELALTIAFAAYQLAYWNGPWRRAA